MINERLRNYLPDLSQRLIDYFSNLSIDGAAGLSWETYWAYKSYDFWMSGIAFLVMLIPILILWIYIFITERD